VVCACDHLADFGTRFAALQTAPVDVFVQAAPLLQVNQLPGAVALYAVLCALVSCGLLGCARARSSDASAAGRYAAQLGRLQDLQLIAELEASAGKKGWQLDALLLQPPPAAAAGRASAAVAPAPPALAAGGAGAAEKLIAAASSSSVSLKAAAAAEAQSLPALLQLWQAACSSSSSSSSRGGTPASPALQHPGL
jgi:hypothetical protein